MKEKQQKQVSSAKQINHETLLNLVRVSNLISNLAASFFGQFKTSDAEFNILMTLNKHAPEGLSQKELSEELVIKKSNLVGIIDKLEEKKFVTRNKDSVDRRSNTIYLTPKGKQFMQSIEDDYFEEVNLLINNLKDPEKSSLIQSAKKLSDYLSERLKAK